VCARVCWCVHVLVWWVVAGVGMEREGVVWVACICPTHLCVCLYTHMCYTHLSLYAHAYVHTYVHLCVCVCVCVCVRLRKHMYTCGGVYACGGLHTMMVL
jgi:hypothetical protein